MSNKKDRQIAMRSAFEKAYGTSPSQDVDYALVAQGVAHGTLRGHVIVDEPTQEVRDIDEVKKIVDRKLRMMVIKALLIWLPLAMLCGWLIAQIALMATAPRM